MDSGAGRRHGRSAEGGQGARSATPKPMPPVSPARCLGPSLALSHAYSALLPRIASRHAHSHSALSQLSKAVLTA